MGRSENDVRLEMLLEVIDAEEIIRTLFGNIMSADEAEKFLDYLEEEYPEVFEEE